MLNIWQQFALNPTNSLDIRQQAGVVLCLVARIDGLRMAKTKHEQFNSKCSRLDFHQSLNLTK